MFSFHIFFVGLITDLGIHECLQALTAFLNQLF
jgi:hypothetical protein